MYIDMQVESLTVDKRIFEFAVAVAYYNKRIDSSLKRFRLVMKEGKKEEDVKHMYHLACKYAPSENAVIDEFAKRLSRVLKGG